MYGTAKPAVSAALVTLPECKITVYIVPAANGVVGVIVRILPFMFIVYGTSVAGELVNLSSKLPVPSAISSLKLIDIVGFL